MEAITAGRAAVALGGERSETIGNTPGAGLLIINADDWGRDRLTTEKTLDCARSGALSSVSAMVFMEDSQRAAALAREHGIDAGLHLNFTTPFAACPARLAEHQERIARRLRRHRLARVMFYPGLQKSFEYVAAAQRDEFQRLYGEPPRRLDGHHHMHLCTNVLMRKLLPGGTSVRRNFSFEPGEKSIINRLYRRAEDYALSRRHRITDFFFSLAPFDPPARLERIFTLARRAVVELETHPVEPDEYRFLAGGEIFRCLNGCLIAPKYALPDAAGAAFCTAQAISQKGD